ncbi:mucin-2-like [Palaemon carinicauda]|uniref:mucin-2-like n=1 Tax=Palaemon carinicauda TaxID=392227 RepID=UPI0035B5B955
MGLKLQTLVQVLFISLCFRSVKTETYSTYGSSCCFGDKDIPHGEVVLSIPVTCRQLVCNNGIVELHRHGDLEDKNCCEFDGKLYSDCSELTGYCLPLMCNKGLWIPTGNVEACCKSCHVYDDPHIISFDGYRYDWHGHCNYSLAQRGFGFQPQWGVFSDFKACNGLASCLHRTTFKDNCHTVITLDCGAVTTLYVNGEEFTVPEVGVHPVESSSGEHPVLTWRAGQCVVLLGSSKIAIHHCPHRIDIWAYPNHAENTEGLCGHFDFNVKNDFTARNKTIFPLHYRPFAYPHSWLTDIQSKRFCGNLCPTCAQETTANLCGAQETELQQYRTSCLVALQDTSNIHILDTYIGK